MGSTLLIGVGGSGCAVAQQVYQRIKNIPKSSSRYAILGIDTDTGDIEKCKAEDSSFPLVQISSNRTIYDTIKAFEKTGIDVSWIPENLSYEVNTRTLLDGAGQLRFLSRLAIFENMLGERALEAELNQIKRQLFANINDIQTAANRGAVDVMMIGSIAGGTGSGIFIPIALIMRDWLESLGVSAIVRGFFLLPNVFIGRGLPVSQYENVRANAYASLAETHAVLQATQGSHTAEDMRFEYSPGKFLQTWDRKEDSPKPKPFQFVYLLDGAAPGGRSIAGDINDYYRMASDCAFQLLHTPLGAKVDSINDNEIRIRNADCVAGTSASFAALGVSGIVYPQNEIEAYLSSQYSAAGLTDQWLKIDLLYQQEIANYFNRKNAGDTSAVKPDRGAHFTKAFDDFVKEALPTFKQLYQQIYRKTKDGDGNINEEIGFVSYLEAVDKRITDNFWDAESVEQIPALSQIDLSRLDSSYLESECIRYERSLEQLFLNLESHLNEEPHTFFRTLWTLGETTPKDRLKNYHIQKWIFISIADSDETPHPLSLRYFLYKLRELISDKLVTERASVKKSYKSLSVALGREAGGLFDNMDTEDIVEGPVDELREGLRKNLISRFISGFDKDFKERYEEHYRSVVDNFKIFGNSSCRVKAYELINAQIDELINLLEDLFSNLDDLNSELRQDIETQVDSHGTGKNQGDNYLYILADRRAKEALWQTVMQDGSTDDDSGINRVLISELYKFYKRQRDEVKDAFDTQKTELDGISLFRDHVINGYVKRKIKSRYASKYQMSVIEAVHRQEQLYKSNNVMQADENLLTKLLEEVYRQSQPFVDISYANQDQHFSLWGLSPKIEKDVHEYYPNINICMGRNDSSTVTNSDFFDNELLLFDISPGLEANNLNKFAGKGEYVAAYEEQSGKILQEMWETPGKTIASLPLHLDYRWHKPGILPSISGTEDEKLQLDKLKTYLLGDALNLIIKKPYSGKQGFFYGQRLLILTDRLDSLLEEILKWPPLMAEVDQAFQQLSLPEKTKLLGEPKLWLELLVLLRWQNISFELVGHGVTWLLEQMTEIYSSINPTLEESQIKEDIKKEHDETIDDLKLLADFQALDNNVQEEILGAVNVSTSKFFNAWQERLLVKARDRDTLL
ncbi:MAG: tubulin-like doman-containing protein [Methylococcaceae bacterium]